MESHHLFDQTPSAEDIVQMTSYEAHQWCDRLKIVNHSTLQNSILLKRRIVNALKSRNMFRKGNGRPILQFEAAMSASKSSDIKQLIDDIRAHLKKEKLTSLLHNQTDLCQTKKDYERAKELAERERPTIFIAGATSSGKSTLVNALIGEAILPTGHNATSSIPCEIKQGEKRKALFRYQKSESPPKEIDLENDEGQKAFDLLVREKRLATKDVASNVEVFCSSDVLKHVTLIDSPGLDANFSLDTLSSPLTEQCQIEIDKACGFIYVIDASRPVEGLGGQIGSLLEEAIRLNKSCRLPESELFILNKWDVFIQKYEMNGEREQATKEYLSRLNDELESWGKFHPSQVITINSELAAFACALGIVTDELQNLCNKICQLLHQMRNNVFLKALKKPMKSLDYVYQAIRNAKRSLRSSAKSGKAFRVKNVARLKEGFQVSLEANRIAKLQEQMDETLESLSDDVIAYLQSKESIARALDWQSIDKNEKVMFNEFNLEDFVTSRQKKEIFNFYKFKKPLTAVLELKCAKEYRRLNQFEADVYSTESRSLFLRTRNCEDQKTSAKATSAIEKAIFCAAMLMFFPLSAIYGAVELVQVFLDKSVQKEFEREYRSVVEDASAMKRSKIKSFLRKYLIESNDNVRYVYKDLPRIFARLKAALSEEDYNQPADMKDLNKCTILLERTKTIVGKVSKCRLDLEIEDIAEDDIDWSYGRSRAARGNFGDVYKVKLHGKEEDVALKVSMSGATNANAENLLRELLNCRRLHNKDNFVSFYGLVRREDKKIGFAFEWCSGGSLKEEMFGENSKFSPSLQSMKSYFWAKQVVREIFVGLASIHNDNLVHRDVKPDNIMLTSDRHVKIGDLGSAKDEEEILDTESGTSGYMAPEVLIGEGYRKPVDIYSVAIIMWELWHGHPAYDGSNNTGLPFMLAKKVTEENLRPSGFQPAYWTDDAEASLKWRKLMEACWDSNPFSRPSAVEAYEKLSK